MVNIPDESSNSFLEKYAKNLDIITFLILALSMLTSFVASTVYFELWLLSLLLGVVFLLINSIITNSIVNRHLHPYRIIRIEQLLNYLLIISALFFYLNIMFVFVLFMPNSAISNYSELFQLSFFMSLTFPSYLFVTTWVFLTIPVKIKVLLRIEVALLAFEQLNNRELKSKWNCINKYFKWFRDGLKRSNFYMGIVFPNNPQVIDMNSYYDHAYLKALIGNEQEILELKDNIIELRRAINFRDFRRYLISLNCLKGITKEKFTTDELSKLITIKTSSTKIKEKLKWLIGAILIIIGFIASLVTIFELMGLTILIT